MRVATAGTWDPQAPFLYFLAGNSWDWTGSDVDQLDHDHILAAVNDLGTEAEEKRLPTMLDKGADVMLDSGVFWLAARHARAHNVPLPDALGLPPEEIDGFDWLWTSYVRLAETYGDRCWGYVEIDQGGADRKRATRSRLEALGLRPIPVYHPLNDGWDYFDELCSGYDRVCFSNLVQANREDRNHLVATMWERKRRYPDTWIHLLGVTPSEQTLAYPANSSDSSSWVYAIRYGAPTSPGAHAMGKSHFNFGHEYSYDTTKALPEASQRKAVAFLATGASFLERSIRDAHRDALAVTGAESWPAILPGEDVRR